MAKKRLTGYTFDASAKTVTHADFSDITLEGIQLIVNVTDQIIIYNFADTAKGGTLSTDTLTLEHDTTSMDDTDQLMILVDDASTTQAISAASLPLPTGAATATNQSTANTALAAIETATEAIQAGQLTDGHNVTVDNASGVAAVNIQDGGNTITVDGTVAVTNAGLTELAAAIDTELQVDVVGALPAGDNNIGNVDVVTSALPTGASTAANQTTANTALAAIETAVEAIQAAQLPDGHNVTVDNASIAVTGTFWQATQPVSLASVPSHAVTNAGTFAVQNTAATPAGTNNIGDVDIASIAAGDNNIGNVDIASIAAGDNNIGNVDIASIAAGDNNIGNVDLASALPAGTNAVGKLLPPDVDVTTHTNYAKKYYTNAGAVTDGIVWSPAAGKRWHVVSLFINVSAAATVTLEDDLAAGDSVVMSMELAANSGVMIPFGEKYPLASGEDAADLLVTTTAGNVYITITGYEI